MQRLRQSLPYFRAHKWEPEIIAVDWAFVEVNSLDNLLVQSFPADFKIHWIKAWTVEKTRKFGLGSLSMRSYFHFMKKGNEILSRDKFDLVFFSTTAFHVLALGPYWKKKFGVPFIIDIQDPWRNDFYLDKPRNERPPKFRLSYSIDKYLEARTIPKAAGIIAVSKAYIDVFHKRYPGSNSIPALVLPFGGNKIDFDIAAGVTDLSRLVTPDLKKKNIIYIGRGGNDLKRATGIFFGALKQIKQENPEIYKILHCWFIGTSYALSGKGIKTIFPIAEKSGVSEIVTEISDRLPYYETLYWLRQASLLFIPGSTDTAYTASKIYPYILSEKKILAIFHEDSSVVKVIAETQAGVCLTFNEKTDDTVLIAECKRQLLRLLGEGSVPNFDYNAFEQYSAKSMADKMLTFFDDVIKNTKG